MMNYKMTIAIIAIFIVGFITTCDKGTGTEPDLQLSEELTTQLDQLIDSTMQADNLPSVVVGVWIPREGNYSKSFGKANLETGADRQFETPFRIASITKTFSATVILSLADDGLLSTSDPFVRYGEGILKLGEFYGHNGTIFGFSTEMFYLPPKDAVIVINVNRLDLDDNSWSSGLFTAISKIVFPDYVSW